MNIFRVLSSIMHNISPTVSGIYEKRHQKHSFRFIDGALVKLKNLFSQCLHKNLNYNPSRSIPIT